MEKIIRLHPPDYWKGLWYMKRVVDRSLLNYLEQVLDERNEKYSVSLIINTDMSDDAWGMTIKDAKCEKQRLESNTPDIPVVSFETLTSNEKMINILDKYKTDCFFVLNEDQARVNELN